MTNGHSSLLRRQRSPAPLDKRKLAIGGEVLSAIAQVVVGLLGIENQTKILLFIIFLLSGLAVLVWWSGQSQVESSTSTRSTSNQLISFLIAGALIGLAVIAQPTIARRFSEVRRVDVVATVPGTAVGPYYVRVHVYRDDGNSGEEEGTDPPLPNIVVTIRDQFGTNSTHRTGRTGDSLIRIPRSGEISIGVCHNWQTHNVSSESATEKKAASVKIGIDPVQADSCRP